MMAGKQCGYKAYWIFLLLASFQICRTDNLTFFTWPQGNVQIDNQKFALAGSQTKALTGKKIAALQEGKKEG